MAILGLFECQVLVDGVPLQEYDDGEENGQSAATTFVMKYVEATSGANFAVKFRVMPEYKFKEADHMYWPVTVDGNVLEQPILKRKEWQKGMSDTRFGSKYGSGSEWFLRKFLFSEIATGGESHPGNVEELKIKYDQLGSIKVEVWRRKDLPSNKKWCADPSKTPEAVPEKALKGKTLTIATRVGEAKKAEAPSLYSGRCLDAAPTAVFVFQYRSKGMPNSFSISTFTADAEAVRVRVKKEKAETNLYTLRAVKRFRDDMGIANDDDVEAIAERSAHKKQRPAGGQEVVDLSD